jgi:hypothetical protein
VRFDALRLHEIGMIKPTPQKAHRPRHQSALRPGAANQIADHDGELSMLRLDRTPLRHGWCGGVAAGGDGPGDGMTRGVGQCPQKLNRDGFSAPQLGQRRRSGASHWLGGDAVAPPGDPPPA